MDQSQSNRNYSASIFAALITAVHFLANMSVFGWFYWIAPRWKKTLEEMLVDLSRPAKLVIWQSDSIINYWYLLAVFVPAAIVADYLLMLWLAKWLGIKRALIAGICIAVLILMQLAFAHYVVSAELTRLMILRLPR